MRLLGLLTAWLLACSGAGPASSDRTGFGFGSYLRVKVLADTRAMADSAGSAAMREMLRLDTLLSIYYPGSEVNRVNLLRRARVSVDTRTLLERALGLCQATDGLLDITVLPLLQVWGFTGGVHRIPSEPELRHALDRVDWRRVRLIGDTVVLEGGALLDLGSVAVGYAVDRGVEVLRSTGASAGLIDAGGDIRVFGDRVWRIGLQDPRGSGVLRVLRLSERAVSTSGDYQKCSFIDGRRCHHLFDPRTGYPADGCVSATVLAPTALAADAYSTACFVAGESADSTAGAVPGLGAVLICQSGDTLITREVGELW